MTVAKSTNRISKMTHVKNVKSQLQMNENEIKFRIIEISARNFMAQIQKFRIPKTLKAEFLPEFLARHKSRGLFLRVISPGIY
jgi:hypothetical protein